MRLDPAKLNIHCREDWGWLTTFLPYGETLRKHRSFMHRFIGSTDSALDFREDQVDGVHAMLKAILDHPDDYGKYVNRYVESRCFDYQAESR